MIAPLICMVFPDERPLPSRPSSSSTHAHTESFLFLRRYQRRTGGGRRDRHGEAALRYLGQFGECGEPNGQLRHPWTNSGSLCMCSSLLCPPNQYPRLCYLLAGGSSFIIFVVSLCQFKHQKNCVISNLVWIVSDKTYLTIGFYLF